jgi:hypothetical protein
MIKPLQPSLIYFCSKDVGSALRKICEIRGQEFEAELFKTVAKREEM